MPAPLCKEALWSGLINHWVPLIRTYQTLVRILFETATVEEKKSTFRSSLRSFGNDYISNQKLFEVITLFFWTKLNFWNYHFSASFLRLANSLNHDLSAASPSSTIPNSVFTALWGAKFGAFTRGITPRMDRFCHYYKVGPLLVVNEVINFISRVFTSGKPIYRAIYRDCNSIYNDRLGGPPCRMSRKKPW